MALPDWQTEHEQALYRIVKARMPSAPARHVDLDGRIRNEMDRTNWAGISLRKIFFRLTRPQISPRHSQKAMRIPFPAARGQPYHPPWRERQPDADSVPQFAATSFWQPSLKAPLRCAAIRFHVEGVL